MNRVHYIDQWSCRAQPDVLACEVVWGDFSKPPTLTRIARPVDATDDVDKVTCRVCRRTIRFRDDKRSERRWGMKQRSFVLSWRRRRCTGKYGLQKGCPCDWHEELRKRLAAEAIVKAALLAAKARRFPMCGTRPARPHLVNAAS